MNPLNSPASLGLETLDRVATLSKEELRCFAGARVESSVPRPQIWVRVGLQHCSVLGRGHNEGYIYLRRASQPQDLSSI